MPIRLNTEKKFDNENFKVKLGTTNKINPQVIYLEGRSFISPNKKKNDYTKELRDIEKTFKSVIGNAIRNNNGFYNRVIIDFQVAQNGLTPEKRSFLSFQVFLKQDKENIRKITDVLSDESEMFSHVLDSLSNVISKNNFSLFKSKK